MCLCLRQQKQGILSILTRLFIATAASFFRSHAVDVLLFLATWCLSSLHRRRDFSKTCSVRRYLTFMRIWFWSYQYERSRDPIWPKSWSLLKRVKPWKTPYHLWQSTDHFQLAASILHPLLTFIDAIKYSTFPCASALSYILKLEFLFTELLSLNTIYNIIMCTVYVLSMQCICVLVCMCKNSVYTVVLQLHD